MTQLTEDFRYDPFSPEAMSDPLPIYRRLRRDHPVYYIAEYDAYFLSRFADVYDLLSVEDNAVMPSEGAHPSPEVFRRLNHGQVTEASTTPLAMHHMHGEPVYEILRQAHGKPLRAPAVQRLAEFIREQANERLDILLARGRFDLVQHYAGIVAAAVQCHLFRLPLSEAKYVLDTINAGSLSNPIDGSLSAERFDRLCEIVQPGVQARRRSGWDGSWPLVDGMLDLELDGRRLSDREIAMTIGVVLLGGTETVPKIIAHGLWALQQHPEQLAEVRRDLATNAPIAFKEMVRMYAPAQWFIRTVHKPITIGGTRMEVGQRVVYLIPSAARDECEYGPDAEQFRWNRPIRRWVNFGHGQHFCLGYHLALLEGSIMVEEFLRRVPEFTVIEDQVVRRPSSFQWSYNALPISVSGDNAYTHRD